MSKFLGATMPVDIRRAATDLFAVKGFRATTVGDIARVAGIGKGSVYLHWSGKDELYLDCVEQELDAARATLREATVQDPSAVRLARMTGLLLDTGSRHPLVRTLVVDERFATAGLPAPARRLLAQRRRELFDLWRGYLETLGEQCLISPDASVDDVSHGICVLMRGLVEAPLPTGEPTPTQEGPGRAAVELMVRQAFDVDQSRCPEAAAATVQDLLLRRAS